MKTRTIYFTILLSFLLLTSVQCGEKMKKTDLKCTEICLRADLIRINAAKKEVEVNVVLHNPTKETLWFLGMSCGGPSRNLVYREKMINPIMDIHCNVSYPKVYQVLPNADFAMRNRLILKKPTDWLKIGFNLVKAEQYYTRNDIRYMDIPSNFMNKGKIIWADSMSLK